MIRNDAGVYDLHKDIVIGGQNLNWRMGDKTLSQLGLSESQAQSLFNYAWQRWSAKGRNSMDFVKLYVMDAALMESQWINQTGSYAGVCDGSTIAIVPMGRYKRAYKCDLGFGQIRGNGTRGFYTNAGDGSPWGGSHGQGGTCFEIDHDAWLGTETDAVFMSSTWGNETLFGYHESFGLFDCRIDGRKRTDVYDPARKKSGLKIWDMGSGARIDRVFIENMEGANFHFARGTFVNVGSIVTFRSNLTGVYFEGGGQGTFEAVESDENPSVFRCEAGWGRGGGVILHCDWLKVETGPAPGRPTGKGTMVMDSEGWTEATFEKIFYAAVGTIPNCMFRVNNTSGNNSFVDVDSITLFGACRNMFHDVKARKVYRFQAPGGLNANGYWGTRTKGFRWDSDGGGTFTPHPAISTEVVNGTGTGRLAVFTTNGSTGAPDGTWDEAAWLPKYQFTPAAGEAGTTPPPNPNPAPLIHSFTASPSSMSAAGNVTLAWDTSNATSVAISTVQGPLAVDGQVTVPVTATKTFTLTATGPNGTATATATVTISTTPPPNPGAPKYTIDFDGKNAGALPGCVPISGSEIWKAGVIQGGAPNTVLKTDTNTSQIFTAPITGVTKVVLKGCTITDAAADWKWVNDEIRTQGGKFRDKNGTGDLGAYTLNQKKDYTINFPSPVSVERLLGGVSPSFYGLAMTVEGVDIF